MYFDCTGDFEGRLCTLTAAHWGVGQGRHDAGGSRHLGLVGARGGRPRHLLEGEVLEERDKRGW